MINEKKKRKKKKEEEKRCGTRDNFLQSVIYDP